MNTSQALAVPLGMLAGLAATLFGGAGVGALAQPGLRALGVGPIGTIATSLTVIFPAALLSSIRYRGRGLIRREALASVAVVGLPVAVVAALFTDEIPGGGHGQQLFVAVLLIVGSSRMLWTGRNEKRDLPSQPPVSARVRRLRLAGAGGVVGVFSGALGLSGGIVLVPTLVELAGYSARQAVATSTIIVAVLAVPSAITHAALGHVDWAMTGLLTAGVVPGVLIGSSITLGARDRIVRLLFGWCLLALGIAYWTGELVALT